MIRLRELVRLHRSGASAREVVRMLRMGPNTERAYRGLLATAGLLSGEVGNLPALNEIATAVRTAMPVATPQPSPVDPWRPRIEELMDKGLSARATFDRIRVEPDPKLGVFGGSYSAVKRARLRTKRERGVCEEVVVVPVPTSPGLEAQVDFGYAGRFYDPATGVMRRAWIFVFLLCHSRLQFVKLVFDQRVETWLSLHEQAFRAIGGVPAVVLPDNTRRAVLRAAFGISGPTELERSYRELAQRWGFMVDPAPPGDPRKRGKVEASVKYALASGVKGREGSPIDQADAALQVWNREVANKRVHGSTGLRPIDVFEAEERAALRPLPATPIEVAIWKRARVHPDCHVTSRGRLFSVPWQLVHDTVWVRVCGSSVEVFHCDRRVAVHEDRGLRCTTLEEHLPEDRRELRHRGQVFWEARAARIGAESFALVRELFARDPVLSQLRQAQAVVRLLDRHPPERAEAACRLARRRGDCSYQAVKQVLAAALDVGRSADGGPPPNRTHLEACA
ncbi:MAG: IS21 family transposase [Planctomycetes bacterium]|nr:IS21 family transposase [Planctomycetota bacterium]